MTDPRSDRVAAIAAHLYDQHQGKKPYRGFAGSDVPQNLEEAYAVQFALQELLVSGGNRSLAGYKVAVSSKPMQAFVGVDKPIAGALFSTDIHRSPYELEIAEFDKLGIEFELAFEIGDAARVAVAPFDENSIREIIIGCRPSFELAQDRRAIYGSFVALGLAADNAWCGGVVLGPQITDWQELDLNDLPASLYYNDELPQQARTGDADPLGSLAWVANHLHEFGRRLEPGQIVITGSTMETRFPEPGDHLRYDVGGLAEVIVRVR